MRLAFSLFAFPVVFYAATGAPALSDGDTEKFLSTAQITATKPLTEGTTKSYRVTLTDGKRTHDAHVQYVDVFKPIYKTPKRVEKNFRDSYKYNIAAYKIDRLLGMNMVPVSIYREIEGKPASITWWVDDVMMTEKDRRDKKKLPPASQFYADQWDTMSVFDQLILNVDRNQGNILITNDWQLKLIDHTRAFRLSHEIDNPKNLLRCDYKLLRALRELNREKLAAQVTTMLTPEEVDALFARRDKIVEFFDRERHQRGDDAIISNIPRGTPVVTVP